MPVNQLPTFKGYTVDYRLREFRLMNFPDKSEFISFQSPQGYKMLQEFEREVDRTKIGELNSRLCEKE